MNTLIINFVLCFISFQPFAGTGNSVSSNSSPSDPKLILEGIQKFYTSHDYIYHELTYILYSEHSSTRPYSTEKGIFIKQGAIQYSQLASIESLTTKDYTMGIDHDEKEIMISNHISIPPTNPLAKVQDWIGDKSLVTIKPVSDHLSTLIIKIVKGEIEESSLTYDIKTYEPVKLVMKYRRSIQLATDSESPLVQPRLEIEYNQTSLDGKGKERLNINAYLFKQGNSWKQALKYKDYELINNIHEFPESNKDH